MNVRGYDQERVPETAEPSLPTVLVDFRPSPDEWTMSLIEDAQSRCRELNGFRVHIGLHYCQFEVEEVQPGKFAIVCKSHPELKL
jgi:hypothetical protein